MQLIELTDARPRRALARRRGVRRRARRASRRDPRRDERADIRAPPGRRSSRPSARRALLTPLAVKADLIASLGVEELIVVRFDAAFAATRRGGSSTRCSSAASTPARSRSARTSASARGRGDAALLAADGRFAARVVPLREVDGEIVSSSRIRALIAAGEVARAGDAAR